MLIPEEERREALLRAGVPETFLDAIDNLEEYGALQYLILEPEAAYDYLPTIEDEYEILDGYDIVPICDGPNGDSFYVLLLGSEGFRFVYFELEADEIYHDFKDSFQRLLAHLVIDWVEFTEGEEGVGNAWQEPLKTLWARLGAYREKHLDRRFEELPPRCHDCKDWMTGASQKIRAGEQKGGLPLEAEAGREAR